MLAPATRSTITPAPVRKPAAALLHPNLTMGAANDTRLKPGDSAPVTGLYRVYHYAHRMPHDAFVPRGDPLPACNTCGERVRFVVITSNFRPVEQDRDLRQAS